MKARIAWLIAAMAFPLLGCNAREVGGGLERVKARRMHHHSRLSQIQGQGSLHVCFPRHPDLQATTDGNSFNISGREPNARVRRNLGSTSDMKTVNVSNFASLSYFATLGGYEISVDGHITFPSTISITGSTWIYSSTSAILDGNGTTRLFDIVNNNDVASNVTFTGLVLTNGFVQASVSIFVLWIYSLISVLVLEMVAG